MQRKERLFTPGPTPVPPEVLLAMAAPMTHHRQAAFEKIFVEVSEKLKTVFQTSSPVLILAGSGTSAMEGSIVNTLSAGDAAISVNAGKFGERWGNIGKAYGVNMHVLNVEWGSAVDPAQIEETLKAHPEAKAVFTTLNETSTTVLTDVKAIAAITAKTDAILVVDGISGVAADELRMDEWGVDIVLSGSQKALMLPPGMAFAALSPKAQAMMKTSTLPKFYLSFEKALKSLGQNTTPWTPAVSTIIGMNVALDRLIEEGMEAVWARHAKLAEATRAGIVAMGMKTFAKSPSNAATSILLPESVDGGKLHKKLRDEYKVTCAGGQDHMKGRIERIAHMGFYDQFDMLVVLGAVELALKELGADVKVGEGVAAAQRCFAGV
jgi:aspartate aminotransferase-like enzyme